MPSNAISMFSFTATFFFATLAAAIAIERPIEGNALAERQCEAMMGREETKLVRNGDVKRWNKHIQISSALTCSTGDSATCEVAIENGETLTVEWNVAISAYGWVSEGLAVSESTSTAEAKTCGGDPGDVVCIWQKIPHNAYMVRNYKEITTCAGTTERASDPFRMWSPLSDEYFEPYCVIGAHNCRKRGDFYWEKI